MIAGRLDRQIEAAVEARERIGALDELREAAETLGPLLAEQQLQRQLALAEQNLAGVKATAKADLGALAVKATDWRERFVAVLAELDALTKELPELQNDIWGAGMALFSGAQAVNRVGYKKPPLGDNPFAPGTSYSIEQKRAVSLDAVFSEAGATNPALVCVPRDLGQTGQKLAGIVGAGLKRRLWDPSKSTANLQQ